MIARAGLSLSIYCWSWAEAGVASRPGLSPTLEVLMAEKRMLVLCLVAFAAAAVGLVLAVALHL